MRSSLLLCVLLLSLLPNSSCSMSSEAYRNMWIGLGVGGGVLFLITLIPVIIGIYCCVRSCRNDRSVVARGRRTAVYPKWTLPLPVIAPRVPIVNHRRVPAAPVAPVPVAADPIPVAADPVSVAADPAPTAPPTLPSVAPEEQQQDVVPADNGTPNEAPASKQATVKLSSTDVVQSKKTSQRKDGTLSAEQEE